MKEAELYSGIIRGALAEGWALYRIPDGIATGKKPFDIGGFAPDGRGAGVEVKLLKNASLSIMWSEYKEHQKAWMQMAAHRHAYGIALQYSLEDATMRAFVLPPGLNVGTLHQPAPFVLRKDTRFAMWTGWRQLLRSDVSRRP